MRVMGIAAGIKRTGARRAFEKARRLGGVLLVQGHFIAELQATEPGFRVVRR
jgi:hypothetical protein